MRLVVLTWRDSTHPDGGGSEIFVEEVARELTRRGHDVTIRCARYAGSPATVDLDGVHLVRRGGRLTVYPRAVGWLATRGRRYDAVVDVINGLPFGTPLVRRRGVVALIHHTHERQWQIIYPGLWGRLGWWVEHTLTPRLYRGLPHLTVSDASRADLIRIGVPEPTITVVRNGVRVVPTGEPRSATPRLVVLARLVPHKQVEHAFDVVDRLRADLPDLHLDVVGDGWWRSHLETYLREHSLEDRVTLHGHLPDEARDRLLARAWAMLLPSVKEGWGLAIMEAAAQGTPTVAYRSAGGVRESIVDGHTGVLVDDRDDFVRATRLLLRDAEYRARLGQRAQERARTFSWSRAADVVEAAVVAGARKPGSETGGNQSP